MEQRVSRDRAGAKGVRGTPGLGARAERGTGLEQGCIEEIAPIYLILQAKAFQMWQSAPIHVSFHVRV